MQREPRSWDIPSQPLRRHRQPPSCALLIISAYFPTSNFCASSRQSSSSSSASATASPSLCALSETSRSSLTTTSFSQPPKHLTVSLPVHDHPLFAHSTSLIRSGLLIHLSTCRKVFSRCKNCSRSQGAKFGTLRSALLTDLAEVGVVL